MAKIYPKVFFNSKIMPLQEANISVASSAVLYGLSVYTVFNVSKNKSGKLVAFRLPEHFRRLINSAHIIGIDQFEKEWNYEKFVGVIKDLIKHNKPTTDTFVRVTVHVDELLPGTRSRNMHTNLSIFLYEAAAILPTGGARLKTSTWRRIPDFSIPSRAKVNGAYVNSVLAKQDALDSGYDDCVFLDTQGHVCELSAANIFVVRHGKLITPDTTNDLLEGINRRTIIQVAKDLGIAVQERAVDLTELYIADEAFAAGTSAYVAPIVEVDARRVGTGKTGPITKQLKKIHREILSGNNDNYLNWITELD